MMEKFKKLLKITCICICLIFFILFVIILVSRIPKRVQKEFIGYEILMCNETENENKYEEEILQIVDIYIDGYLYSGFLEQLCFIGKFEAEQYPYTLDTDIKIIFDNEFNNGLIYYMKNENGKPVQNYFGIIYTDNKFSSFAIRMFETLYGEDVIPYGKIKERVIVAPAMNCSNDLWELYNEFKSRWQ